MDADDAKVAAEEALDDDDDADIAEVDGEAEGDADIAEMDGEVDFEVDLEFRNKVLAMVAGPMFKKATRKIMEAFEARAKELS